MSEPNGRKKFADLLSAGASITTIVFTFWPHIVGIGVSLGAFLYVFRDLSTAYIVAIVASPVLIVSIVLFVVKMNELRHVTGVDVNPDWKIINQTRKAIVKSPKEIEYHSKWTTKARRQTDTLKLSWSWTGNGTMAIQSVTPNVKVVDDDGGRDVADHFRLIRSTPVRKGATVEWEFIIRTQGTVAEQKPFFSVGIKHGNMPKMLSLAVKFEADAKVDKVWYEHHIYPGPPYPISRDELEIDENGFVLKEFKKRLGRRHAICWTYNRGG